MIFLETLSTNFIYLNLNKTSKHLIYSKLLLQINGLVN